MNTTITMCGLGLALAAGCVVPVYGAATTGAGEVAVAPAVEPAADMETFRSLCAAIDYNSNDVEAALCRIRDMAEELLGWEINTREVKALLADVERRVDEGLTARIKNAKAGLGYPATEAKSKALYDLLSVRWRLFRTQYQQPDPKLKALPEIDAVLTFTDKRDYAHYYKKRADLVHSYLGKLRELRLEGGAVLKRAADTADMLATPTVYTFNVTSDGRLVDGPHRVNVTINGWGDWAYGKTPNVHQIVDFTLDRTARWHINDGGAAVTFGTERWLLMYHERVMVYENSLEQPLLLSLLRRHGRTVKIKGDTFSWTTEGITSYKIQANGMDITEDLLQEAVEKVIQNNYWKSLRESIISVDDHL